MRVGLVGSSRAPRVWARGPLRVWQPATVRQEARRRLASATGSSRSKALVDSAAGITAGAREMRSCSAPSKHVRHRPWQDADRGQRSARSVVRFAPHLKHSRPAFARITLRSRGPLSVQNEPSHRILSVGNHFWPMTLARGPPLRVQTHAYGHWIQRQQRPSRMDDRQGSAIQDPLVGRLPSMALASKGPRGHRESRLTKRRWSAA